MTSELKRNIVTSLKTYPAIAISGFAPDFNTIVSWIRNLNGSYFRNAPLYQFTLATQLTERKIDPNSSATQNAPTSVLPPVEIGDDPILHYLEEFRKYEGEGAFVFCDLHKVLHQEGAKTLLSLLHEICVNYNSQAQAIKRLIILGEELTLPSELRRLIPIINFELPNEDQLNSASLQQIKKWELENLNSQKIAQSALGLTGTELLKQIDKKYHSSVLDEIEILKIHLLKAKRIKTEYANHLTAIYQLIISRTEGYSGAELEELVLAALNKAYLAGRPGTPNQQDFMSSLTTPLAILHPEKYQRIKQGGRFAVPTKYPENYVANSQEDPLGIY